MSKCSDNNVINSDECTFTHVCSDKYIVNMESETSFLSYCNQTDNFKWKGSVDELVSFINKIFDMNGELSEDVRHNSTTYKLDDASIRFYHGTKTLKLFGAKAAKIRDKFYEILEIFMAYPTSDQRQLPSAQSPSVPLTPCHVSAESQSNRYVLQEDFRQELDSIKRVLSLLKSNMSQQLSYDMDGDIIQHRTTICKLEREALFLNEEVHRLTENLKRAEIEKQSLLTTINILISENDIKAKRETPSNLPSPESINIFILS